MYTKLSCIGEIAALPAPSGTWVLGMMNLHRSSLFWAALLLLALLARLIHLRKKNEQRTGQVLSYEHHLSLLAHHLTNVTVFQLVRTPDGHFSIPFLSNGYEETFGISREKIMKDPSDLFKMVWKEDVEALRSAYTQAQEKLHPIHLEIRIHDHDAQMKWLRINAVPSRENEKRIWVGFMQDITDSKKVEAALIHERHNFKNLFDTIDDFLFVCDKTGNILHSNPAIEAHLAYTHTELAALTLPQLFPSREQDRVATLLKQVLANKSATCAIELKTKPGPTIPVEMNMIRGVWHNQDAIFSVARNIARRKVAEKALRESQEMLELIMNTIPISVFWKDRESNYIGCNRAFVRECDRSDSTEIIGKSPYDLFDSATAQTVVEHDQQVLTTNSAVLNFMQSRSTADGSLGWWEASKIPLHDENGHPVGVLGLWRDVTEQSRAEERLKRTLEDMERFNQLMRGRERRTLELKAEVNKLLKEQGKHIKYRTTSARP